MKAEGRIVYFLLYPQGGVLSMAVNLGVLLLTLCGEKEESQGGPGGRKGYGNELILTRHSFTPMKCF